MNLTIINPLELPDWDDLVAEHKSATFFHSSSWARVLYESYNYTPQYFSILNNKLEFLLPLMKIKSMVTGKRWVSLPFSDYCSPICKDENTFQEVFTFITNEYLTKPGWKSVEIRGGKYFFKDVQPYKQYVVHYLELGADYESIFSNFRKGTKSTIKKAKKEKVKVTIKNDLASLKIFYHLHCITRKHHGLPPQPFNFFRNVYKFIIEKGFGNIFVAYYSDKPIASSIFFNFGYEVHYKYSASDRKFHSFGANNLILWEAIKYYCERSYKNLYFGRSEQENKGLIKFKSGWGSNMYLHPYYKYNLTDCEFTQGNEVTSFHYNTILSKMPISMLRAIGALSYRHIG